ncbi:DUF2255 family protein [Microbacterium esteraromaticum]|uniref:DUF2255 family protein n=1 Tax=Microbacterium esteraromaticum TaxID=57043 RepID=UPI001A8E25D4|nr:DUF2255 family protein [Microbacterium esteraromaticum]MBN8424670.1 DUF2255 family protein [Microbacterium esteraromaticum]
MTQWAPEDIRSIRESDVFHIAPFRDDGTTPGTLTWIWAVVVDDAIYVRAYNGTSSRWYGSAVAQRAGRVSIGGTVHDATFVPVDDTDLNERIDEAYRAKYAGSPYLPPMLTEKVRAATVRVDAR